MFSLQTRQWLCWVEAHPGLAAWVQAIGSIAAIAAAIRIASRQHSETENRIKGEQLDRHSAQVGRALYCMSGLIDAANLLRTELPAGPDDAKPDPSSRILHLTVLLDQMEASELSPAEDENVVAGVVAAKDFLAIAKGSHTFGERARHAEMMQKRIEEARDRLKQNLVSSA